jgi:hypothetical protein
VQRAHRFQLERQGPQLGRQKPASPIEEHDCGTDIASCKSPLAGRVEPVCRTSREVVRFLAAEPKLDPVDLRLLEMLA